MNKKEWLKLIRDAKDNGRYYMLRYALCQYMSTQPSHHTIDSFIKGYDYDTINMWYQREWFRDGIKRCGGRFVNVPSCGQFKLFF